MKKGFTLIELVATVSILAIIVAMVAINLNYFVNNEHEKERDDIKSLSETNTKVLVETNDTIATKVNNTLSELESNNAEDISCYIRYSVLVDNKLMDKDTKYPAENKSVILNGKSYIKVSLDNNDYKYEFIYVDPDSDSSPSITNCLN